MLMADYKIEISKDREGDSIFTHPDGFKTRVLCKGAEQIGSIRGEKFGAYRPDLILVDDLEADEQVANPEVRQALLERFKDALEPAIDPETGCIHVVGTILHEDSVMKKLITLGIFKQYRKLLYKARYIGKKSGETKSLWPERWTVEQLNEMEREEPSKFAKEYQNDPVSGMMSNFDKEDFRYWYIENGEYVLLDREDNIMSRGALSSCKGAIGIDLAWGEKKKDDFSVLMPAYMTPNSEILIDEYISEKGMKPDKFVDYLFPMHSKVDRNCKGSCVVGFEKGKIEKIMKWFLKKEEQIRNKYIIKKDALWDNDKISRIVTRLQSRYKNHVIFHRRGMGDLEHQLLQTPSGKHDDLCLVGKTRIITNKGNKRIDSIKIGDKVLTRDGYKKVINVIDNGYKEVITRFGITGTPNHPIITKNGIKRLDTLSASDILYIWNEKLSYIEERNIIDTQIQKEGNIGFTFGDMINGKSVHSRYIDKYGLIILGKFLKNILYTIKMAIHLITNHQTLNVCQDQRTLSYMQMNQKGLKKQENLWKEIPYKQRNGIKVKKDQNGTANMRKDLLKIGKKLKRYVSYVLKSLKRNIFIRNSVVKNVDTHTITENVYNLTVEDNHEYFANNILVHNCDAAQILVQMFQNPPSRKKVEMVTEADEGIDWLMKNAINKGDKPKKNFSFGKKSKQFGLPAKKSFR
jgi:hypothetical protein